MQKKTSVDRRQFLKQAGLLGGLALAGPFAGCQIAGPQGAAGEAAQAGGAIAIVADPADAVAASGPGRWAVGELAAALKEKNIAARMVATLEQAGDAELCIVATSAIAVPEGAEALAIIAARKGKQAIIFAAGKDARGLVYAVTDLADRVRFSTDARAALQAVKSTAERPANKIRSVMRMFVSDVEDLAWFHDRDFWKRYLTMLVTNRFNRFNLALGLGYDDFRGLRDTYLFFAYPFLLSVPGYDVRAAGLSDADRDRNLATLKFISSEAASRGLHFQLGLWTHAFQWETSPRANYTITGLTPEKHAAYCRDALEKLLRECPDIHGITFRVHGESGVAEGSYDFWKTVFDGVARVATPARPMEIDMHAKGMDQRMIDAALAAKVAVNISPKLLGEHMGLPYHAASIREVEMPKGRDAGGQFALSNGTRSFLRYGYGDLLNEDRKHGIIHRIWPGTQRLLLWGDPAFAADFGRMFSFCGSLGFELFDPLGFKGRKGTGINGGAAGRSGYADKTLVPAGGDWEKYLVTYSMWGRLTYNPDGDVADCYRQFEAEFKAAGPPLARALANASRILPLVTSAHAPSAGNNDYWPEVYANQSIVDAARGVYNDTPAPRVFGNVSPLDPQLFATINGYADALLRRQAVAKVSPVAVAQQLMDWSNATVAALVDAKLGAAAPAAARRVMIDASLAAGLGRFFAAKICAGILWGIFDQTSYEPARQAALGAYRRARDIWADIATRAADVYVKDLTFGTGQPGAIDLRGHWSDRLAAITADVTAMETARPQPRGTAMDVFPAAPAVTDALIAQVSIPLTSAAAPATAPAAVESSIEHTPPATFRAGQPLAVRMAARDKGAIAAVRMVYRHVNQGERYTTVEMQKEGDAFAATIPAEATNSMFSMQYYFEVQPAGGAPYLWPGFQKDFRGQPYIVVRRAI